MNIKFDTLGLRQFGAVPFKRAIGASSAIGAIAAGSAIGSIGAGVAGSAIGASATDSAAEKGLQSTQDTNATNLLIAQENNQKAIELQEMQNQFNVEQWNRNNEYNSPFAQRDRLLQAGYNPNMFGNNSQYTPSPVQQTSIPNLTTPQMQSAADVYLQSGIAKGQYYANMFQQAANIGKTIAETANIKEDTNSKYTYNKFAADLHKSGIEVNDASARKMYADINKTTQEIENMRAELGLINSKIANMDADTQGKVIDNLYKPDIWDATAKKLKSDCAFNDAQIDYIKQKLPYELGLMSAQTRESNSRTALNKVQAKLTAAEIKQVEEIIGILKIQNKQQVFDYQLSTAFDMEDRYYDQELKRAGLSDANWNNTTFMRSVRAAGYIIGSITDAINSIKGSKFLPFSSMSQSHSWSTGVYSNTNDNHNYHYQMGH